jgi:hypothetical protein
MKRKNLFLTQLLLIMAILFNSSCSTQNVKVPMTQLQMRQLQTREYSAPPGGALRVMKALMNTLQDEGFLLKNADKDLGFISAEKESDVQDGWETFFAQLGAGSNNPARYRKNAVVECSANVSEFGKDIRVRAVFQHKVLDNLGGTLSVEQIENAVFYQDFFSKVDKGIFIERQGL